MNSRFPFASTEGSVRVLPLGGLGEIGMNCLVLEQNGEALIIDCGVTFDNRGLGVDVVHPNFSVLEGLRDRIRGVFLTHGHEDHIGGLPYLIRRFDVPIYGTKYTIGLVRERAAEHEVLRYTPIHEVAPKNRYQLGGFDVEPIRVTHSIADAIALAVRTSAGTVIHTGDYKFDDTPPDGEAFDEARLTELGDEGVALLLSDSTNIDSPLAAGSEAGVGEELESIVREAKGAVVIAMFASNTHRLRMLGEIAQATGRRLLHLGRSLHTHSRVARTTGYLPWPEEVLFPAERVRELRRDQILGLATGTQAEANAALARLSRGEHPSLTLEAGDSVVLSSRVIPGNEPEVFAIINGLLRRNVFVHSWYSNRRVHVSGHAGRVEQRRMLDLVRPRAFVPLHGTLHHLLRHAELANEAGVKQAIAIENGEAVELTKDGLQKLGRFDAGRVHIFAGREVTDQVLRERTALAAEGVAFVSIELDPQTGVLRRLDVVTRGIFDEIKEGNLLEDVKREIRAAIAGVAPTEVADFARLAARRGFFRGIGYKPLTVVHVFDARP